MNDQSHTTEDDITFMDTVEHPNGASTGNRKNEPKRRRTGSDEDAVGYFVISYCFGIIY